MEDNAPAHAHVAQGALFKAWDVQRLLWCANSPDLNMIKPAWWNLEAETTKKGTSTTRAEAEKLRKGAWEGLSQERIRAWTERIPHHTSRYSRGNTLRRG